MGEGAHRPGGLRVVRCGVLRSMMGVAEWSEVEMKASVGDTVVVTSHVVDGAVREGRVVEVRHPDGSPPFLVEWADTGERTLVFPGPDTRVLHPTSGG